MLLDCALFTSKSLDQIDTLLSKKHKSKDKTVKEKLIECASQHIECQLLKADV